MLLALIHIPKNLGYAALALFVGVEASGVPVPGETALITSSVLASQGHLEIVLVISIAAASAIVGDNVGYLLGRRFGRRFILRPGKTQERRLVLLERGETLFDRHGPKAVFFGRWIAGLRIWAAWLAGITQMPWKSFLLWNALGGIAWALFFGLLGYWGGEAAAHLVAKVGVWAAAGVGVLVLAVYVFIKLRGRRGGGILRTVLGDEAALLRAYWEALGDWFQQGGDRADIVAISEQYLAPDVAYHEDPSWPEAGSFSGREAVTERYLEYLDLMQIERGEVIVGDRGVIAELRIKLRGQDAGRPNEFLWTYTLQIENGVITEIRAWVDAEEARRAVGLGRRATPR